MTTSLVALRNDAFDSGSERCSGAIDAGLPLRHVDMPVTGHGGELIGDGVQRTSAHIERRGPVLTSRRAAEYCGLAYKTFRNLLSLGEGPRGFKQGRLNAFYPADLDAWLATRLTQRN